MCQQFRFLCETGDMKHTVSNHNLSFITKYKYFKEIIYKVAFILGAEYMTNCMFLLRVANYNYN